MKTKFLQLVFLLLVCNFYSLYAQGLLAPITDSTPMKCKWDLRNVIYPNIAISAPIRYGKITVTPSYKDVDFAADDPTTCTTTDACSANDTLDLVYIVYYPVNHNYDSLPLPGLFMFHAGGFSDCTTYSGDLMDSLCRHYARRGFITYLVEYRRGRLNDKKSDKSIQQQASQYRACQDGRGAIRTAFKKERTPAGAAFKMDTTKIFLAGASSGGTIAINIGYYRNQSMNDSSFPTPTGEPTTVQALGPINANFYVGDTTIDFRPYIKGVMGMWTGPNIPYSLGSAGRQADFFSQGANNTYDNPPYVGFHGMLDGVFPYPEGLSQYFQFSRPPTGTGFNYNATTNCLMDGFTGSYHLDTANNKKNNTADLIQGSSLNMYNILNSLRKLTELYVDSTMGHGVDDGDDFGIGDDLTTPKQDVWLYMVQRGATFFQAAGNNVVPSTLGNTLFIECENTRKKCNTPNSSCPNTPSFNKTIIHNKKK